MENNSISLAQLVGRNILAKIPTFKEGKLIELKLVGVENAGIWADLPDFMEDMFAGTPHTMTPKSFVVFLPFTQILAIYGTIDSTWISKRIAE